MINKICTFSEVYARAEQRKGGENSLQALLPSGIQKSAQLRKISDDRCLSEITKAVFKAGFVWKVIDNKWPNFEKAFWHFNLRRCSAINPDDVDVLMQNSGIVRNLKKIQSVQRNAVMVSDLATQHSGFANMLANWPRENFVGLLTLLNKRGDRLGWQSCQYFCRHIGKDGFVLSKDVLAALIAAGVIDKPATGKGALVKIQSAFNQWHSESGLGLAQISRILALSIDA